MANNCLVTKLKGNVSNNELRRLNSFRVIFKEGAFSANSIADVNPDVGSEIYAVKGTFNILGGDTNLIYYKKELSSTLSITPSSDAETVIEVTGRYNNATFAGNPSSNPSTDISKVIYHIADIKHCNFAYFDMIRGMCTGSINISEVPSMLSGGMTQIFVCTYDNDNPIEVVVPDGTNLSENIRKFDLKALNAAYLTHMDAKKVSFNLTSFNYCTNLAEIISPYGKETVRGDINSLCDTLYANGRTSGTLKCQLCDTACTITLNGVTKTLTREDGNTNGYNITVTFTDNGWTAVQN